MSQNENEPTTTTAPAVRSAGAFDVRSIIGGLLGLYGILLLVVGLWFTSSSDKDKADGENLNVLVGIGLLVFAVLMIGWVVLRPLKVPVEEGAPLN
jgi:glucose uptake protein GlcU